MNLQNETCAFLVFFGFDLLFFCVLAWRSSCSTLSTWLFCLIVLNPIVWLITMMCHWVQPEIRETFGQVLQERSFLISIQTRRCSNMGDNGEQDRSELVRRHPAEFSLIGLLFGVRWMLWAETRVDLFLLSFCLDAFLLRRLKQHFELNFNSYMFPVEKVGNWKCENSFKKILWNVSKRFQQVVFFYKRFETWS